MNYCLLTISCRVTTTIPNALAIRIYRFLNSVQSEPGITIVTRLYIRFKQRRNELVVTRERKIFFRRPDDRYTPLPTGIIIQKARCSPYRPRKFVAQPVLIFMGRKFSLSGTPFNFIPAVSFRLAATPRVCTCQKMKRTKKRKRRRRRRRRRIINDGCAIPRQKWRHGVTSPWGYIKRPRVP